MRTLGLMTSGGDAPGMNAAIRSVTRDAFAVAEQLRKLSRIEYRVVILGYIQRGGNPTASERCLATHLGAFAVRAILNDETGKMAGEANGRKVLVPFPVAVKGKRKIDPLYGQMLKFLNR